MRAGAAVLFGIVGVMLLWSAVAKATLNPVSWILYWFGARRRLAVVGLVILLLLALSRTVGDERAEGLGPLGERSQPPASTAHGDPGKAGPASPGRTPDLTSSIELNKP